MIGDKRILRRNSFEVYRIRSMVARMPGLCLALFLMMNATSAVAQTTVEPIRYAFSFPAPHTHYVEVSAEVSTGGRAEWN